MKQKSLKVYFDGLCHLCSREIAHYRRVEGSEQIEFVDITSPKFDAKAEGVDPKRVHLHLHARKSDGTLAVGVDAFVAIWSVLKPYRWLARIARTRPASFILNLGYRGFARIRPLLPRKKANCEESPYCETK